MFRSWRSRAGWERWSYLKIAWKRKILVLFTSIFIFAFGCGGIDSDVVALAEKECECETLKGIEQDRCDEEYDEMEEKLDTRLDDMDIDEAEEERLENLYEDTYEKCSEWKGTEYTLIITCLKQVQIIFKNIVSRQHGKFIIIN